MWNMDPSGFISIVQKPSDIGNDTLTVRARDKVSLAEFLTECGIATRTADIQLDLATDYPYRAVVAQSTIAQVMYDRVMRIDYSNFKDEAKRRRNDNYPVVLGSVWFEMLNLETKKTRKAISKANATTPGRGAGGASGGGYGSLFKAVDVLDADDWNAIFHTKSTDEGDRAEFERLCDLVASSGIQSLTDQEYAFYENYSY